MVKIEIDIKQIKKAIESLPLKERAKLVEELQKELVAMGDALEFRLVEQMSQQTLFGMADRSALIFIKLSWIENQLAIAKELIYR